jgi:hypothetical protein
MTTQAYYEAKPMMAGRSKNFTSLIHGSVCAKSLKRTAAVHPNKKQRMQSFMMKPGEPDFNLA